MTAALLPSRTHNAIYELCAVNDRWPTLMELSKHIGVPPVEVSLSLNELVSKRMVRERERDTRRVWVPWAEG